MSTFSEAHQVRVALKMKLSNYAWYNNSRIVLENDDYYVVVSVTQITNKVKQLVPPLINGVSIKTE